MQHRKTLKVAASVSALGLVIALGACSGEQKPETPTVQPAPTGQGEGKAQPSDGEGTKETPSAPSEDTASSGEGGVNSGCSLPDGDQKIPNTAPPVDEWANVNGVGVPTSKTYGPEKREGDLYGCYAHSPTGALFAATYIMPSAGNTRGFADIWVAEDIREKAAESESETPSQFVASLQGYRFVAATEQEVTLDLAWQMTTDNKTALMSQRYILTWVIDHWEINPKMMDTPVSEAPENLEGFIKWSTANG